MPTEIRTFEYDDYVRSPSAPADESWDEYVKMADRLLAECRQAESKCAASPFSPELQERKQQLEVYLSDYAHMFQDKYGPESVKRDPQFIPASRFFEEHYPVREPFAVLHCTKDFPLHSIRVFATAEDLHRVNLALREDTPLRWWHNGPFGRPCYLFGSSIWELKASELNASESGLAVMFTQMVERERPPEDAGPTSDGLSPMRLAVAEAVPNKTRLAVWRRDGGKCIKCGSRKDLDFRYIVPPTVGGSHAAANVQLLCEHCREAADANP